MRAWLTQLHNRPPLLVFSLAFVCLFSLASRVNADIIHHPHFKIDAMVIVWSGPADQLATPRLQIRTGKSVRINTAMPVISADLIPLPTQSRYDEPVPLRDNLMGTTSFYVASNSAFSIDAQLSAPMGFTDADLANLEFKMSAHLGSAQNAAIGQRAQYAHSGGENAGFASNIRSLADLRTRTTVFHGNQRTAAARGTIAQQSIRFETAYRARQNTAIAALPDIVFTVFVP